MDEETYGGGNAYDFGARIHDTRLGRFLSIDPYTKAYPSITTYSFGGNSPILFIDKDGKFPWLTGLIGAGVNIAVGYIGNTLNGEKYTWKDAGRDGAIGFVVGSGMALFTPLIGIQPASTLIGKVIQGGLIGAPSQLISNAFDQTWKIANGDQEFWDNEKFAISGVGGLFGGAAAGGMSKFASQFMDKVGDKMFKDFTKSELRSYINIQTTYLKKQLEATTGGKVGYRQLKREVEKAVENWKEFKISEINLIKFTATKASESSSEVLVTVSAQETATRLNKK
jgi:RHS repeat-associated protein